MTTRPYLKAEAIINSLCITLNSTYPSDDLESSLQRIRGMLAHLPEGSLCIVHDGKRIRFFEWINKEKKYLKKNSDKVYLLARKRYLLTLQKALIMKASVRCRDENWNKCFEKLANLIREYEEGRLALARIVLTKKQYSWFVGGYKQKRFVSENPKLQLTTKLQVPVRSKSEQNIGNKLLDFAVANHYEERLRINVSALVDALESDLIRNNLLDGPLYYYQGNCCIWNVPKELQWMNATGSAWRTYNSRTGCLTIHPDFTVMLIDGSLLYWEHEGLLDKFIYRTNARERSCLMRICNNISQENIIETSELESNDPAALDVIIQTKILPRLWF